MRKKIFITGFLFFTLSFAIVSCGGGDSKTAAAPLKREQEQYRCPMKCTEEVFDKPGNCPKCGMELEKITNS